MTRHHTAAVATTQEAWHQVPLTDQRQSLPNTPQHLHTNLPAYPYFTRNETLPKKNHQSLLSLINTPTTTKPKSPAPNMKRKTTLSLLFHLSPLPKAETPVQYQRHLNTALVELPDT